MSQLRVLLIDRDQPPLSNPAYVFRRLRLRGRYEADHAALDEALPRLQEPIVIALGNHRGYGLKLAPHIPERLRASVVVLSNSALPPEARAAYEALGITQCCLREGPFAEFLARRASPPPVRTSA